MTINKKRQKIRKNILLFMFFLFPIIYYYLSPYLVIMGAFEGVITGSLIIFSIMFITSIFLGRVFCGWICPAGGEQELCTLIRDKRFKGGKRDWIKYFIWVPWLSIIGVMFYQAGGIQTVDFFYQTYYGISINSIESLILFIIIAGIIAVLAFLTGRRGFCHILCWMAPFMITGNKIGCFLKLPALRLSIDQEKCIHCEACSKHCPMSLDVYQMVQKGIIENIECILCGTCIDICPEKVIGYSFYRRKIFKKLHFWINNVSILSRITFLSN